MAESDTGLNLEEVKLRILLIHQGRKATAPRSHSSEYLTGIPKPGSITPILSKFGDQTPKQDILTAYMEKVDACEAAVALVTEDPRPASQAGNLWLEIGLWGARKGFDSLLICVQKTKKMPSKHRIPSDIIGRPAPRFEDYGHLDALLLKHVNKIRNKKIETMTYPQGLHHANGRYLHHLKIRDTLGSPSITWSKQDLGSCNFRRQTDCNFRKESLIFVSELLRMGRTNREHMTIQEHLAMIGSLVDKLIHLETSERRIMQTGATRIRLMHELQRLLLNLREIAKELLRRPDTNLDTSKSNWPWERIQYFLNHRLDKAVAFIGQFPDDFNIQAHIGKAENFCKSAKDYISEYEKSDYFIKGDMEDPFCLTLLNMGQYASDVSAIMQKQSEMYFMDCRECIKSGFEKVLNHAKIWEAFHEINEMLPQNVILTKHPEIWPMHIKERTE